MANTYVLFMDGFCKPYQAVKNHTKAYESTGGNNNVTWGVNCSQHPPRLVLWFTPTVIVFVKY